MFINSSKIRQKFLDDDNFMSLNKPLYFPASRILLVGLYTSKHTSNTAMEKVTFRIYEFDNDAIVKERQNSCKLTSKVYNII